MMGNDNAVSEPPWLIESKKAYRHLYGELDVILKGIARFFHTDNLPLDGDSVSDSNFRHEMVIVRDSILRGLNILDVVLPENKKNAYWFRKFTETKFLPDYKRDSIGGSNGHDPEKSTFRLYESFVNFKGIINDVLQSNKINFLSFKSMGDLITKEIKGNTYINPFGKNVDKEYDRIENSEIKGIVKNIKDKKLKRVVSTAFILLFRDLRYLGCIDITTSRNVSISCGVLILTLLRSEIRQLIGFFERELSKNHSPEMNALFNSLIFQFSMESKRVFNQEMKHIFEMKSKRDIKGKIENSHGILKNLIEQNIVQIAEYCNPSITGEKIFSIFTTRYGQSQKLREDVFILHRILEIFEANLNDDTRRASLFESLKNYIFYFESFTFRLLRHDDYEIFVKFFAELSTDTDMNSLSSSSVKMLAEKIHNFKIFLESTLSLIDNRAELKDNPIDREKAEQLLRQYIH